MLNIYFTSYKKVPIVGFFLMNMNYIIISIRVEIISYFIHKCTQYG